MNKLTKQYSQLLKTRSLRVIAASLMAVSLAACLGDSGADNGQVVNTVELPTDAFTYLYCPEVGVGEENCVLFDPGNPYVRASVTDDTKFQLADDAPSAKSRFYLWSTALARNPRGENQFYTADSLHSIFSLEASVLAQDQAKKAYRSVLDNFFGSVTFSEAGVSFLLRNFVADRIVNPGNAGLPQLYASQPLALQALDEWGYLYDANTATISKKTD